MDHTRRSCPLGRTLSVLGHPSVTSACLLACLVCECQSPGRGATRAQAFSGTLGKTRGADVLNAQVSAFASRAASDIVGTASEIAARTKSRSAREYSVRWKIHADDVAAMIVHERDAR